MPTTRLVSRLWSGVRLLTNGMLTNSVASSRLVANLPLINSNDYLWCVKWQRDIFVVALVSKARIKREKTALDGVARNLCQ